MEIGTEHWRRVAGLEDAEVREHILAGYLEGKPFTPYEPTIEISHVGTVLDFGCGLGRNLPYLKTVAQTVIGYDLPEMIDRAGRLDHGPRVELTADLESVLARPIDLVFASLVLQHLEPEVLRSTLRDFADIGAPVYLMTRAAQDFGGSTLSYVAERFTLPDCTLVDHHPATHALRQVGMVSASQAVDLTADDVHMELLLEPSRSRSESAADARRKWGLDLLGRLRSLRTAT